MSEIAPTIRVAIIAGVPWLDVYCCPGCRTRCAIDIRQLTAIRSRRLALQG
jgi:hypothetical protein